MTEQSDTPRTDKACIGFARILVEKGTANEPKFKVTEIIPADFARQLESDLTALRTEAEGLRNKPIDIVLFCPKCSTQHIDAPDERTEGWNNPPHKSHLCHGCGHVWRPSDHPTNGIASVPSGKDSDVRPTDEGLREKLEAAENFKRMYQEIVDYVMGYFPVGMCYVNPIQAINVVVERMQTAERERKAAVAAMARWRGSLSALRMSASQHMTRADDCGALAREVAIALNSILPAPSLEEGERIVRERDAAIKKLQHCERYKLPPMPEDIQEWCWHMDLHITELDLNHAGKALRAAWPQVSAWLRKSVGPRTVAAKPFNAAIDAQRGE